MFAIYNFINIYNCLIYYKYRILIFNNTSISQGKFPELQIFREKHWKMLMMK